MEDRYLFKAKDCNSIWRTGLLIALQGDRCAIEEKDRSKWACDSKTICQCTGLKDKNGKLIWENDIVKCVDENNDIEFTAIIEFGNPNGLYSWGYQLQRIKGDEPNLDILLWVDMEEAGATCKVIGNIFDNPELLESEG